MRFLQIVNAKNGVAVTILDKNFVQTLGLECRKVLIDVPNHRLPLNEFQHRYEQMYHKKCAIEKYTPNLAEKFVRVCINLNL